MVSAWADQFGSVGGPPDWLESYQGVCDFYPSVSSVTGIETYFSASSAIFSRVWNPRSFRATHAYVLNGSVVSGNIDIGIYDAQGRKISSTGAIAQSGVSQIQWVTFDVQIPKGEIILGFVCDNITAQFVTPNMAAATFFPSGMMAVLGFGRQESAYPLPTTIASIIPTQSENIPLFGVVKRWV